MPNPEEQIKPEVFDHLVGLAALDMQADEAEYLRQELNSQLAAVRELEAIDLPDDLPLAAHGVPYPPERRQALRPDHHEPFENSGAILKQGPQTDKSCFVVPDIPHTDLE